MSKEKEIEIEDPESEQTANEEQPQPEVQEAEEDIEMAEEAAEADPVAKLEAENAELKDQLLRKIAEFDNYRKRTIKEKTDLILNGGEKTIVTILPVIDDMERALKNMKEAENILSLIHI